MLENIHYKATLSHSYTSHKPQKIIRQNKYMYVHGKGNTIDVFDKNDFTLIKTLEVDSKRMIIA